MEASDENGDAEDDWNPAEGFSSEATDPFSSSSSYFGSEAVAGEGEREVGELGFRPLDSGPGHLTNQVSNCRVSDLAGSSSGGAPSLYAGIPDGMDLDPLMDPETMMIPNSQSSPTTGSYQLPLFDQPRSSLTDSSMLAPTANGGYLSSIHGLEHTGEVNNVPIFYGSESQQDPDAGFLNLPSQQLLTDLYFPSSYHSSMQVSNNYIDTDIPSLPNTNNSSHTLQSQPDDQIHSQRDYQIYSNEGRNLVAEDKKRASSPQAGSLETLEDGYNWRKYGQKQVKGSEYPRSYYKCTHPNCEMKKKVERAQDGCVTGIIYKSNHNHPMPPPSRPLAPGSAFLLKDSHTGEDSSSRVKTEGGSIWRNMNSLSEDNKNGLTNWSNAGLDRMFPESDLNELSNQNSPGYEKCSSPLDSAELSSTLHGQDADDDNIDETDSKRRRTDDCMVEPNMASWEVRENKIMVQIESEVDILDDGYRWRKYGQKVVKGNPNPRSYYKCTTPGCSVKKHIERDPQNIKDVITTYEGKHNHEVPPAKNSTSPVKNVGQISSVRSLGQSPHMSLTRSASMPKLQMPAQFNPPHFERNLDPATKFFSPGLLGMNLRASSSMFTWQQPGMTSSHAQDLAVHSAMAPFDFNNSQGGVSQLAYQPGHDNDPRLIMPKQEASDEATDDSSGPRVHHPNKSLPTSSNHDQAFPL